MSATGRPSAGIVHRSQLRPRALSVPQVACLLVIDGAGSGGIRAAAAIQAAGYSDSGWTALSRLVGDQLAEIGDDEQLRITEQGRRQLAKSLRHLEAGGSAVFRSS